jgi:hypothetical protein
MADLAFWNLVQINSFYLTDTGGSGGSKYQARVEGLDQLALTDSIQVSKSLSGKPYLQGNDTLVGKPISISLDNILETAHDSIVAIIQAYITSGTAITLNFTLAPYGSFSSVSVVPDENPVRFSGEFENLRIKDVSYHFLTTN